MERIVSVISFKKLKMPDYEKGFQIPKRRQLCYNKINSDMSKE